MKKSNMTIGQLIKILKSYPKDYLISVWGGEGANGDFAYLQIHKNKKECDLTIGEIIMEEKDR